VVQKSGYSMYDSQLGGAVESDDTVAFLANTEQPNAYWRGESKAQYDGKGWTNPANDRYRYEMGEQLSDVFIDNASLNKDSTTVIQEVFPLSGYPGGYGTILLAQGVIRSVEHV